MERLWKRAKIRARIAALYVEAWAVRKLWVDDIIAREDMLEDIERAQNDLRCQLLPPTLRTLRETAKASARNMTGPEE